MQTPLVQVLFLDTCFIITGIMSITNSGLELCQMDFKNSVSDLNSITE